MQATQKPFFAKRLLYYWSKVYAKSLHSGQDHKRLPKIYSFNFVAFNLLSEVKNYHSIFRLLEIGNPKICLTEDLEIHIIELGKYTEGFDSHSLQFDLESWILLLREAQNLRGEQMKTLEKRNSNIKKAISQLKVFSSDKKNRAFISDREKAEIDNHFFRVEAQDAYDRGVESGLEKGIEQGLQEGNRESILLGIEIALELKFNSEGLKLLSEIKKINNNDHLRKILLGIKKAKSVSEIRKMIV